LLLLDGISDGVNKRNIPVLQSNFSYFSNIGADAPKSPTKICCFYQNGLTFLSDGV